MKYTCEICTDYIDPSKTEQILQNVARIVTEAYMQNAAKKQTAKAADADQKGA